MDERLQIADLHLGGTGVRAIAALVGQIDMRRHRNDQPRAQEAYWE